MPNPIFGGSFNKPNNVYNNQSNTLFGKMMKVYNSSNPNEAVAQLLSSDSDFQNVMTYINQNGGDARTAVYNLAAKKGINPNDIINKVNAMFGGNMQGG